MKKLPFICSDLLRQFRTRPIYFYLDKEKETNSFDTYKTNDFTC